MLGPQFRSQKSRIRYRLVEMIGRDMESQGLPEPESLFRKSPKQRLTDLCRASSLHKYSKSSTTEHAHCFSVDRR